MLKNSPTVCILLVTSGSGGDKLLFRYPNEKHESSEVQSECHQRNPYAVRIAEDYNFQRSLHQVSYVKERILSGDETLANILSVKSFTFGQNFEVKINDVVFVSHPVSLRHKSHESSMHSFHVVFALQAIGDSGPVAGFHNLAKQLTKAIYHEQNRCGYLSEQKDHMLAILDDVAACPEDSRELPWVSMIQQCQLAKELKRVYDSIEKHGSVDVFINNFVRVCWYLPQAIYNAGKDVNASCTILPKDIRVYISSLRPYHGLLMLDNEMCVLEKLPLDSSPALARLLQVVSPMKNLHELALDTGLALSQVYKLAVHLVLWAKAIVIYPLCEKNVYMLAPGAKINLNDSKLSQSFESDFPGCSLLSVLAEFSLPSALGERKSYTIPSVSNHIKQPQLVVWLLRYRLLLQLHTYVFLIKTQVFSRYKARADSAEDVSKSESDIKEQMDVVSSSELSAPVKENLYHCIWHSLNLSIEDLKAFIRLSRYFDGKSHLEAIMYLENMERSHLLIILDKFRDLIITCQHADPGLSPEEHEKRTA